MPFASECKSSQVVTATIPGQPARETHETTTAQLTGTRSVLAVNDKGDATKISVTVSKCTSNGNPVLDAGAVIVAERTGAAPATYMINNAPADEATGKVMELVLEMTDPGMPDDDSSFGTSQPQKAGASWPISAEQAAKAAAQAGVPVEKENISGTTTLVGADKVDGKEVLKITSNLAAKDLKGPGPGGVQIQSGDLKMDMEGVFAADDSTQPLAEGQKVTLHIVGQVVGPDNSAIGLELKIDRSNKVSCGAGVQSSEK